MKDEESEIIRRLQDIQIEETKLLTRLSILRRTNTTSAAAKSTTEREQSEELEVGDTVRLLTKGVLIKKGDLATITGLEENKVHFTVHRNDRKSFKARTNVEKIRVRKN